jgi:hypothetical protein
MVRKSITEKENPPLKSKMSILDAYRNGKITEKEFQKYLADGYPKRMLIDV